ncbi:MAG TPA: P-II family nitrogen regulator [Candidatus Accumulibacter sp.]|nr:P-II family nitrogen regulator [Accumulibacter sp.]HRF10541.1 P-II family nitrogen regulator [Candidatus Accumulibacter phosphatis]
MKEIKAFVRQYRIADVLQAVRDSGLYDQGATGSSCYNLTVSQVQRPLASDEADQQHYSLDLAQPIVAEFRLELVCTDDVANALADIIAKAARTGQPEAGWVFVSDIQHVVEIR